MTTKNTYGILSVERKAPDMKKIIIMILAIACMITVLNSCRDKTGEEVMNTEESEPTTEAPSETEAETEPTTEPATEAPTETQKHRQSQRLNLPSRAGRPCWKGSR